MYGMFSGETVAVLRQEMATEAQAGFPLLRRTPCTLTVALLDYYAELDEGAREALLDGLAEVAAGRMVYRASGHPAVGAFHAAMQSPRYTGGYRYTGVKMIRLLKGDPASWAKFQQTAGRPASADLIPEMETMVPARAQQLRKLCRPLVAYTTIAKHRRTPLLTIDQFARRSSRRCLAAWHLLFNQRFDGYWRRVAVLDGASRSAMAVISAS